ncbi:MAG: dolichyl-phosphate-mannose-protein mannosyltransferase [Candidatus Parcubacteria bacterium]|jgi:dolichyl-phosphate-mannose-protein mannosyltransferase|nr:dolichyl-phosphate-mannose-protein mannosyltransferase [Candidatus Parcubacteria bacterium]
MKYHVLALLVLSAVTHFIYFGRPAEVVFDEVHFGGFASAYDSGKYFFDIHPPLGKLLISGAGYIGGFKATTADYGKIGNAFVDSRYIWYRILPMLAGFLLPLVIFFLCFRLGLSRESSFLAGLFVILENSLLVQSRFMLLDSFLLLFGFSALLFYFAAEQTASRKAFLGLMALSAIAAALSFSVKWTGLSFIGLIFLVEIWNVIRDIKNPKSWQAAISKIFFFCLIGFFIYFMIFAVHFALLPKSGPGDAFMTPAFQKTLEGSIYANDPAIEPRNLFGKFLELNSEMYIANETLSQTHQYSSLWYTWPLMLRPIYYWTDVHDATLTAGATGTPAVESEIYLLGNPFIYWLSSAAMLFIAADFLLRLRRPESCKGCFIPAFLIVGYLANWLPFIFITRVMFIYHYFTALIFAIIALAYVVDRIEKPTVRRAAGISLIVLFCLSFIFWSPFSYGLPLSVHGQDIRFWLQSWR